MGAGQKYSTKLLQQMKRKRVCIAVHIMQIERKNKKNTVDDINVRYGCHL